MTKRSAVVELLRDLVDALGDARLRPELTTDPVRAEEIVRTLAEAATARARRIEWVVINHRRVDATIISGDREWRLACSIDGEGVHSASAFEKPAPFDGVLGGRAVIVTGPSSSGKSTVMRALIDAAETPWVMFDEPFFGEVSWPFLIWPDRSPTLRQGFIAGITALAAGGNQVILSAGGQRGPSDGLEQLIVTVPTLIVGLDCSFDVRVARQQSRPDRWGGLTESSDETHKGWDLDARFDTSTLTADEVARRILELVDERLPGAVAGRVHAFPAYISTAPRTSLARHIGYAGRAMGTCGLLLREVVHFVGGWHDGELDGLDQVVAFEERLAQTMTAVHERAIVVEDDGVFQAGRLDPGGVLGHVAQRCRSTAEPAVLIECGSAGPRLDGVERKFEDREFGGERPEVLRVPDESLAVSDRAVGVSSLRHALRLLSPRESVDSRSGRSCVPVDVEADAVEMPERAAGCRREVRLEHPGYDGLDPSTVSDHEHAASRVDGSGRSEEPFDLSIDVRADGG